MDFIIYFISILVFFTILLLTAIPFYTFYLQRYAAMLKKRIVLNQPLNFTFEQIVFFFTRPSLIPALQLAEIENIELSIDHVGLLRPKIKGMKVLLHHETTEDPIFLAYLALEDFRSPTLDKLLKENKITQDQYLTICANELILPTTQQTLKKEVINQLKTGRYPI